MLRRSLAITLLGSAPAIAIACGSLTPDDPPTHDGGVADASVDGIAPDARPPAVDAFDSEDAPVNTEGSAPDSSDGSSPDSAEGSLPDRSDGSCGSGDFYVRAGDAGASFASITAALAAANASCAAAKTVYVGPGTYTAATGESFPLLVRGVSLVGAGSAATTIEGTGPIAGLRAPKVVSPGESSVAATLQIGSSGKQTTLSGLRVAAGSLASGSEAIVCDEGSVPATGVSLVNTLVSDVTIDSYEIGVRLMSVPPAMGCGLRLSGSVIQNGAVGVYAEGNAGAGLPVSAQLDGANTFQNLSIPTGRNYMNGGGLVAYGNVSDIVVRGNRFASSDQGIFIDESQNATVARVDIESNDIEGIGSQAIALVGALSVILIDNTVKTVTSDGATPGAGLVVESPAKIYPVITRARGNTFFGTVNAVVFRNGFGSLAGSNLPAALAATDFGTASDHGNNTFRCSRTSLPNVNFFSPGMYEAGVPPIPFEGNVWDHSPPVAGVDFNVTGVTLDVANASTTSVPACP